MNLEVDEIFQSFFEKLRNKFQTLQNSSASIKKEMMEVMNEKSNALESIKMKISSKEESKKHIKKNLVRSTLQYLYF